MTQLTLGLKISSKTTLENYVLGPNGLFIEKLKQELCSPVPYATYLWGGPSCGKTHILQGACHELAYHGEQAAYYDLRMIENLDRLQGLEHLKLLALDNYHALSHDQKIKLKEVLYQSQALKRKLLVASRQMLAADSECRDQVVCYELLYLSSDELKSFLKIKSESRGLALTDDIQDLMIRYSLGNPALLLEMLDTIELRCDQEKKKLSVSFAKTILTGVDFHYSAPAAL